MQPGDCKRRPFKGCLGLPPVHCLMPLAMAALDGWDDRWVAFVKSLGVILVSEIGDKTFFIAAIMAMRNSRLTVSGLAWHGLYSLLTLWNCLELQGWTGSSFIK